MHDGGGAVRIDPASRGCSPPSWDVFDPMGVFLGTVHLPMRARPVAARGRVLWLVESGDLGVQSVVRYRIRSVP